MPPGAATALQGTYRRHLDHGDHLTRTGIAAAGACLEVRAGGTSGQLFWASHTNVIPAVPPCVLLGAVETSVYVKRNVRASVPAAGAQSP
jgi:hypothetical protein